MNNQFGLNTGVNAGWGLTGNTVNDTLNNITSFQEETKNKYDTQKTQELENSAKNMFECSVKSSDGSVQKVNLSGANSAFMELVIKKAAQSAGSTAYDNLGEGQILCRFLQKNVDVIPNLINNTNLVLSGKMRVPVWASYAGLSMPDPEPVERTTNYIPEKKGKSWAGTTAKWIGGTLAGMEGVGLAGQGVGNWLYKRSTDLLESDISREKRWKTYTTLQEDLKENLEEVNSLIKEQEKLLDTQYGSQAQEKINELNIRKGIIEEELAGVEEKLNRIGVDKPQTSSELMSEMDISGSDKTRGVQTAVKSQEMWINDLKPYMRMTPKQWNVSEILKSITEEDVGLSAGKWEEAKKILQKEIKAYANRGNVNLEGLQAIKEEFGLSMDAIEGDMASQGVARTVYDKIYTKLNNTIKSALDEYFPEKGLSKTYEKYSTLKSSEGNFFKRAVQGGKRAAGEGSSQGLSWWQDLKKATIGNPGFQNKLGAWFKKWKNIRPTQIVKSLINNIKSNPEKAIERGKELVQKGEEILQNSETVAKVENTVKETAKKGVKRVKNVNPKAYVQKGMFSSPMDFAGIYLAEQLDALGYEMPIEVLTEIVSYALEASKLNKEGDRDLPLYDKENSYVNQNPNANMSKEEKAAKFKEMYATYPNEMPQWWRERVGYYDTNDESVKELESQPWFQEMLMAEEGKKYDEFTGDALKEFLEALE